MSWQILVGISVLLYSLSVVLQRILLKNDKSEPISFSVFFQVGVSIVTAVLVLVIRGKLPIPNLGQISWSVLAMTVLYALANIFIFKSLKVTEASRFTVIFSSKTLFAVLGTSLFFGESLTLTQWLGVILILLGVVIVSIKKFNRKLNKGDLLALVSALIFGLANINDRFLVKFFDPYSYVIVGFLLPGLAIALFYPKKMVNLKIYLKSRFLGKMVVLCLLYGLSAITFFMVLQTTTNSSQLFAINSFGVIVTVILSVLILKEKTELPKKILGAMVGVIGLLLVNS